MFNKIPVKIKIQVERNAWFNENMRLKKYEV